MIAVLQLATKISLLQAIHGKPVRSTITFTRTFNVPVHIVFAAWTKEKQVAAWWGPYGFTNPVCKWKAEVNGEIYVDMTSADGMVFPMKGCFHQIDFQSKLVFTTTAFEDENETAQLEVINTVWFIEEKWRTRFSLEVKVIKATPVVKSSLEGLQQGWSQSLDKLEELLSQSSKCY